MILVSGGTGLVGSAICKELAKNKLDHYILTRYPREQNHIYFDFMKFDLTELKKFHFDEISLIHCAWYVNHKDYKNSLENLKWQAATEKFVIFLSQNKLVHIVGIGSGSEYLPSANPKQYFDKEFPNNLYAETKINTQKNYGIFVKTKIFHLLGREFFHTWQRRSTNKISAANKASKRHKRKLRINAANKIIDLRDVNEVGKDIVFLTKSKKNGIFNVSSGRGQSIKKIVKNLTNSRDYNAYFEFVDIKEPDYSVGINNVYD